MHGGPRRRRRGVSVAGWTDRRCERHPARAGNVTAPGRIVTLAVVAVAAHHAADAVTPVAAQPPPASPAVGGWRGRGASRRGR